MRTGVKSQTYAPPSLALRPLFSEQVAGDYSCSSYIAAVILSQRSISETLQDTLIKGAPCTIRLSHTLLLLGSDLRLCHLVGATHTEKLLAAEVKMCVVME